MVNRDYRDLFAAFNDASVEFLIVGAYALAVHGHVRATKDLDVWVRPTRENASRVLQALDAFGAPTGVSLDELARPGTIIQLGYPPVRIDILTSIAGATFEDAWPNRVAAGYGDQPVFVIGREALIASKRASGRLQDLADLEALENGAGDYDPR